MDVLIKKKVGVVKGKDNIQSKNSNSNSESSRYGRRDNRKSDSNKNHRDKRS